MSYDSFVELCAGSAAVSIALGGLRPPVPIMGNKRNYAEQILSALGVNRPQRVVLVEPGEWGRTLRAMFESPREVADILVGWTEPDRALFDRLRSNVPPTSESERAAAHLYMSARTYKGKPVYPQNGGWRTHGFDPEFREPKTMGPNTNARGWSNPRPMLADKLRAFGEWAGPKVTVMNTVARALEPFPAWVYIDPPYANAVGYQHSIERSEVVDLARQWVERGATVAISEAEPLFVDGWRHVQLRDKRRSRAFGSHEEWLTIAEPK